MNTPEMTAMREWWYGWQKRTQIEKENLFDTVSFQDLTMKMRAKARYRYAREIMEGKNVDCDWHGSNMASNLCAYGSPYWSDFQELFPHHFMKCHYDKLPSEHHEMAAKIVVAVNKLKGGAWAYALCLRPDYPDYEKHPLRQKILTELGCQPADYDATANLMRTILQSSSR